MTEDINEQVLVQRAREGDLSSFSALVERYQERAVHIAYSCVGNYEDARDLAQDAFVKAYEGLPRFEEQSRFYTWFYRILVNTCKDFLKKRKLREYFPFFSNQDGDESESDIAYEVIDKQRSASERLSDTELEFQVSEAMEQLPTQQRTAFALRYLEGFSLEAISQSMNVSVGGVKATLWQAIQKMRHSLKGLLK